MEELTQRIRSRLLELRDEKYRAFMCKLMPTVPPERVIGVRTPDMKRLAAELFRETDVTPFLDALPHEFYEENNLHVMLLNREKDYDKVVARLEAFLPYVDNWATCDIISPRAFGKYPPELPALIRRYVAHSEPYTVRFGIEMLMNLYLEGEFSPEYPELVAAVSSEEYYVNMMRAWYFATALAKRWDDVLPYLTEGRLDKWTHNKTIQKAVESFRITAEQKDYLRTLRRK